MDLQRYLERIDYVDRVEPTLDVLFELVRAHIFSIPFENLDVQLGRSLTTEPVNAYHKIVEKRRGGWCYEQNGLFGWALGAIGFEVTRAAAAVMRADRGDISTANHLCLMVRVPGNDTVYLVDVGFGGSLTAPLELRENAAEHVPFRVGLRRLNDGHWQFWENFGKGEFSYDFLPQPGNEKAMADKCEFLQTNPASNFVLNLVAQLRTPDQHKALRGRVLTITHVKGQTARILNSASELVATLAAEFGLDMPEVAELWPRIVARHDELFD